MPTAGRWPTSSVSSGRSSAPLRMAAIPGCYPTACGSWRPCRNEITERIARAPVDLPDIHPNVADIYRRKAARLADALNHPEDRHEAADALRGLIERIVLKPSPKPRQLDATLYGELGTIVEWVARVGKVGPKNT